MIWISVAKNGEIAIKKRIMTKFVSFSQKVFFSEIPLKTKALIYRNSTKTI